MQRAEFDTTIDLLSADAITDLFNASHHVGSNSTPDEIEAAVERVLQAMTLEQVQEGVIAFEEYAESRGNWERCFLGRACGDRTTKGRGVWSATLQLAVRLDDVHVIANLFDGYYPFEEVLGMDPVTYLRQKVEAEILARSLLEVPVPA